MSDDDKFWAGANWIYIATILNDGVNSGNHSYTITPGAGNELEILYGNLFNGDSGSRLAQGYINDGDDGAQSDTVGGLLTTSREGTLSIGAGDSAPFPGTKDISGDGSVPAGPTRLIVAGVQDIQFFMNSVSVSQESILAIVCRIRGAPPTVALTSPTGATETVNRNQVF